MDRLIQAALFDYYWVSSSPRSSIIFIVIILKKLSSSISLDSDKEEEKVWKTTGDDDDTVNYSHPPITQAIHHLLLPFLVSSWKNIAVVFVITKEEEEEGIEQLERIIMSVSPRPSYCAIDDAFRDWGGRERRDNTIFPLDNVALNRITSSYVRKKKKKERRFNYCLSESGKKKERKKAPWDQFDIKQQSIISFDIFFPPSVGRPVANKKSSRKMKTSRRGDEGSWTSFDRGGEERGGHLHDGRTRFFHVGSFNQRPSSTFFSSFLFFLFP